MPKKTNNFHEIFLKLKSRPLLIILILAALTGVVCRYVFIADVAGEPIFDVALPKTDLMKYDILAKNLLRENPLEIKTASYPLFVQFLKVTYKLFGTAPMPLYRIQLFLSLLTAFLVAFTGALFFGWVPGIIGGLFFLFYKMNYLYDVLRIHTVLSQFLIVAALFFFCAYYKKRKFYYYLGFTVFGVILCFFRVFFWFIIIPAFIYLIWRAKHYKMTSYIIYNVLACLLAVFLFYYMHPGETYTYRFGVHLYIGNHSNATGLLTAPRGIRPHAEGFAVDTILKAHKETGSTDKLNNFWIQKTIDSYEGKPLAFFGLLGRKFKILTNNFEPHNNTSVYYYEKRTILDKLPKINFSVIFSFAMAGILLMIIKKHEARLLLFPFVFLALMIMSVFLCSRYRLPLIPFLCLFAGYGVTEMCREAVSKRTHIFILMILLLAGTFVWSNLGIRYFVKEYDVRFWERAEQKKVRFSKKRNATYGALDEWNELEPNHRILLTERLGRYAFYYEFFEHYDEAMMLAQGKPKYQIILLKRKAKLYEVMRNFRNAVQVWEELGEFESMKEESERKIRELNIVGPMLEKDFSKGTDNDNK